MNLARISSANVVPTRVAQATSLCRSATRRTEWTRPPLKKELPPTAAAAHCPSMGAQRGSAILVVMVLLGVMILMVIANTTTLHLLRQELDQIDKQQQKKYGQDSRH
jgi:hypothetical protein